MQRACGRRRNTRVGRAAHRCSGTRIRRTESRHTHRGAAASPDGRLAAVGAHDGTVELHDLEGALRGDDSLFDSATHESRRRLRNVGFDDKRHGVGDPDAFGAETTVWELTGGLQQAWSREGSRDRTEEECQTYFESYCADFDALLASI